MLAKVCDCSCRDERHPRPGTKRPREDDDHEEEEDLNESNFDEVNTIVQHPVHK